MSHRPQEGAVRLEGTPSLLVEGSAQWVSLSWEEGGKLHALGSGVPDALSSSIAGYLKSLADGSLSPTYSEWVLSLTRPVRALQARPGPGADEVTFQWQAANDGTPGVDQTVTRAQLETWPAALDLYGEPDPEEVRSPDVYDR